ncbi:hypothetical protein L1281_000378 [Neisseria sp. HSC-16F19]|nr:DUF2288 domain-containing protein [Neisseria sp. HSC-16F19]MCP2039808.1 hypothetical protein [Neisseria sp. HSC-16F19]
MAAETDKHLLNEKLNLETAPIDWRDLQLHFARGLTVYVSPELDLVNIAQLMADDNTAAIALLMREGKVGPVSAGMAQQFWAQEQRLWAVVIAPWVLVQPMTTGTDTQ